VAANDRASHGLLHYLRNGGAWDHELVDHAGGWGRPELIADGDGLAVVYNDGDVATWSAGFWTRDVFTGFSGGGPDLAAGAAGRLHLSGYRDSGEVLFVTYGSLPSAGEWEWEAIGESGGMTAIALDHEEVPHVAYVEGGTMFLAWVVAQHLADDERHHHRAEHDGADDGEVVDEHDARGARRWKRARAPRGLLEAVEVAPARLRVVADPQQAVARARFVVGSVAALFPTRCLAVAVTRARVGVVAVALPAVARARRVRCVTDRRLDVRRAVGVAAARVAIVAGTGASAGGVT
jgi:hypothetical protein